VVDAGFLWVRVASVGVLDWFFVWGGESYAGVVEGRSDGPEEGR
jgi:hypothetical protein